jgi:NAD/NADP transhydrogenase alpha subunit
MGHEVLIQRGAGNNAYYGDTEYADAGAMIVETLGEVYTADVVLKATSVSAGDTVYMHDREKGSFPLVKNEEYEKMDSLSGRCAALYAACDGRRGHVADAPAGGDLSADEGPGTENQG